MMSWPRPGPVDQLGPNVRIPGQAWGTNVGQDWGQDVGTRLGTGLGTGHGKLAKTWASGPTGTKRQNSWPGLGPWTWKTGQDLGQWTNWDKTSEFLARPRGPMMDETGDRTLGQGLGTGHWTRLGQDLGQDKGQLGHGNCPRIRVQMSGRLSRQRGLASNIQLGHWTWDSCRDSFPTSQS